MAELDLVIVGAGPAGTAAALFAHRLGLRCALLDRARFPRRKACGGALSGRSVALLRDLGVYEHVRGLPGAQIHRLVFTAPDASALALDLHQARPSPQAPPAAAGPVLEGMVVQREHLDALMFARAADAAPICRQGFTCRLIERDAGWCAVRGVYDDGRGEQFRGRIVLGCDGASSAVARSSGLGGLDRASGMVALRQYMRGVEGLQDQIELHFTDALAPGYFWIFPAGDGLANVGLGVDCRQLRRRRQNLRALLRETIASPRFAPRFRRAEPAGPPSGWPLPVGGRHRTCHAEGVMLLGDAAGLVDSFTGEGIGNALWSARAATQTARAALNSGQTGSDALRPYSESLRRALGGELATSASLHRLAGCRPLRSWVIRRAGSDAALRRTLGAMLADTGARRQLLGPRFYLRLLCG